MPDSRVVKRYVKVTPGIEIPCLNMSIFLSFQKAHIFSRASQKGWTSRLLYQMKGLKGLHIIVRPDLLAVLVVFFRNVPVF